MAIQAHIFPDNLALPLGGVGSQDCFTMDIHPVNNTTINNMFNGCAFNDLSFANKSLLQHQYQQQQQQQQQQQYLLQQLQQNQNHQQIYHSDAGFVFRASSKTDLNNAAATSTSTTTTTSDHMGYSHSLANQLDKQRHSIDKYISVQNERLKLALHQQRKKQMATLMRKLETKAIILLKQKDEEIAKATKKTIELEEHMTKMESENQVWQRVAAENEAMVASLNNALEQVKEQACYLSSSNGIEDAESCCDDNDYHPFCEKGEEATSTAGGETNINMNINKKRKMMMMMCRVCNSRKSCVLMLPCRHLCSCKNCDSFLDACPVCKSLKKASMEALFS